MAAIYDPQHRKGPLALAVSGGGDSMALLSLAAEWGAAREVPLLALTVDHKLRDGSSDDAEHVEARARELGLPCKRLEWRDEKPTAGVQAAARDARFHLMASACREAGADTLALAHTQDDQAETVLMRLARGGGVDALSAMAAETERNGLRIIRPLLSASRAELRATLTGRGLDWREDPSNEDVGYERVRVRQMMATLDPLGIDAAALSLTAGKMGEARRALDAAAAQLSEKAALFDPVGYARLDPLVLAQAPEETARRLLSATLRWVSGAAYAPRREDLDRVFAWLLSAPNAGGRTLHGCQFDPETGAVSISREAAAARHVIEASDLAEDRDVIWDGRFTCALECAGAASPLRIAALGAEGARQVKDWGEAPESWRRAPRAAKLSTPALYKGEELLHAPLAGLIMAPDGPYVHAAATPFPFSLKGCD